TPIPTSGASGTVEAVALAPGTTGTVRSPVTSTRQTAGSVGPAKAESVVAIETTSSLPDSTGATTPGSATVTVAGVPSSGTLTRIGATAPPSSVRRPSGASSVIRANSTASAGAGWPGTRATLTCTRGAPATSSDAGRGPVRNAAVWPGGSAANAEIRPAAEPGAPPI